MKLYVGQPTQHHDLERYIKAGFNLWELEAEPGKLPKLAKLSALKERAPEDFKFSVALSPECLLATENAEKALDYALKTIARVHPNWVIVRSNAQFRPGASNERKLTALVERLRAEVPVQAADCHIGWEPRGLWVPQSAYRFCQDNDLSLVQDPRTLWLPEELPERLYLHTDQLGTAQRVSEFAIEDLLEKSVGVDELYFVVRGSSARRFASTLRAGWAELKASVELDAELGDLDETLGDDTEPHESEGEGR